LLLWLALAGWRLKGVSLYMSLSGRSPLAVSMIKEK
jgi:hypothetical protein